MGYPLNRIVARDFAAVVAVVAVVVVVAAAAAAAAVVSAIGFAASSFVAVQDVSEWPVESEFKMKHLSTWDIAE